MRAWRRRGPLACLLWPLSLLFHALLLLRRGLYRRGVLASTRLPVPVVVIGNVFVGGTGKTPLTIWLAEALRAAGRSPGVISRGYGTRDDGPRAVLPDSLAAQVGDEPLLIARRAACPVMVGADRAATAKALLVTHPEIDILISDDGLQHYALQRDVEIVLCDERGNGNGWLLPAGPLREPASRRRDFTVVNAARLPAGIASSALHMQLQGAYAENLADPARRMALSELVCSEEGRAPRLLAAAGIGNPQRFFAMLREAGLHFTEMPLPDHHDFADRPFANADADVILLTEKDAVKCRQIPDLKHDPRLWVVPVSARIEGALAEQILEKCRGRPIA